MFFKSPQHKERFLAAIQQIDKVDGGQLDAEYASALYILAATLATWEKTSGYVSCHGIDFPAILREVHFSHGYLVLVQLAGNLFNGNIHVNPVELMLLDSDNFNVALTALQLRRRSYHIDEL